MSSVSLKISIFSIFYTCCLCAHFESGRYNLLIRIDNEIEPEQFQNNIRDNLEKFLTDASSFLHKATHCLSSFQEITIVLPNDWPQLYPLPSWENVTDETDFVIVKNLRSQVPVTQQSEGCGRPGDIAYIPLQFLSRVFERAFGDNFEARTIVQQWARLRYGVFEEHGWKDDPTYSNVYWMPAQKLTSCSNQDQNSIATSSIMYNVIEPNVTEFCNETNHNFDAPNRHNILCNYRSVWDVIKQHNDFKNSMNVSKCSLNTSPSFKIVQQSKIHLILVIDSSQNLMNHLVPLHQGISMLVLDYIPNNIYLTLIQHSSGTVTHVVAKHEVTSNTSRENFLLHLPIYPMGMSSEIAALKLSLQSWKSYSNLQTMIFMPIVDANNIPQEFTKIVESAHEVDLVFFHLNTTISNSPLFESNQENVQEFILPSEHEIGEMMCTVFNEKMTQYFPGNEHVAMIKNGILSSTDQTFYVDAVDELIVNIFASIIFSIKEVVLIPPTSKPVMLTHNIDFCSEEISRKMTICKIPNPEAGKWRFSIVTDNSPQDLRIQIKIRCRRRGCVTVRSWMNTTVTTDSSPTILFAKVYFGMQSILNAAVWATLRHSNGSLHFVQLHDNGQDPDIIGNDGIYTAYIYPVHSHGYYYITVNVNGSEKIYSANKSSSAISFQRTVATGSLYIKEDIYTSNSLAFRPTRVLDLRAKVTDFNGSSKLQLRWTAPQKATAYDIRWSTNRRTLQTDFHSATSIASNLLPNPLPFGQQEKVQLPTDFHYSHCFALRANNGEKEGEVSNIVCVHPLLHSLKPTGLSTTIRWINKETTEEADEDVNLILIILSAGLAVTLAALVGILVALAVMFCNYSLHKKKGKMKVLGEREALNSRTRRFKDTDI